MAYLKKPSEIIPVIVDFIQFLSTGETITNHTVTIESPNPSESLITMLPEASSLTGTSIISQKVMNGIIGHEYIMTFEITTSAGFKYVQYVLLSVIR